MKLYNIYYIDTTYGDPPEYEGTTDNFKEWLKQHNKERVADGEMRESEGDFEVEEIHPILFNKENKSWPKQIKDIL